MKHIAKIVVRFMIILANGDGLFVVRHRLFQPSNTLQGMSKIILGFGKSRPQCNRFFIAAHGLIETIESGESKTEILMRFRGSLVGFHGAAEKAFCLGEPALLQMQEAEPAERAEVSFICEQHDTEELFGFNEAPLIVQDDRPLEALRDLFQFKPHGWLCSHIPQAEGKRLLLVSETTTIDTTSPQILQFIRSNFPVTPVPSVPEIVLHRAGPKSGLWRLAEMAEDFGTPYWAYDWGGGLALARHILNYPEIVAGRTVLDLGAGSGIVGIAAAKSEAKHVIAADIDRYAIAAIGLNSAANGVAISAFLGDLTAGSPPDVDIVLV